MDRAFLFENNRLAQKTIEQNIEITKSPEQFHLKRQNVKQGLKTIASDPAFGTVRVGVYGSAISPAKKL